MKRITAAGGMVISKRVMGLLAVTRSFGDHAIKEFVIAEPYISSTPLSNDCEFIVMGCDGVFDVLSDGEVCRIVRNCIRKVGEISYCMGEDICDRRVGGTAEEMLHVLIDIE